MKKNAAITLFLWLIAGGVLPAQNPADGQDFTIWGEIAGLSVGDTLRFERVELPAFNLMAGFDVVVSTPDRFEYTRQQPHAEYYMMTFLPRTGRVPRTSRRGLTMIVDGGTVKVTGTTDWIYFSRVDGEAFGEQPLLREARELENAIEKERSRYIQLAQDAYAAGDSIKGSEYDKQFSEFHREDESKRIRELESEFLHRNPSSPWSLVDRLGRASYTPIDTLEAYYATLDDPARESYFGMLLRQQIDNLIRLLPGQPAPDFQVTLPDGTVRNSEQLRGKYLLIYHWGFCLGSLQREKDATELYNRFKDHFEVLGITDDLEAFGKTARTTPPDAELYGINLKTTYESMAVHPWIDVETDVGENAKVSDLYAFAGFPFFILVSPDGKIVSRGFHETFFETKKILETQYGSQP